MQCTCDVCSEKRYSQERKEYNDFKRLFRHHNWFVFSRKGDAKYYRYVRIAYEAYKSGNTIDNHLKTNHDLGSIYANHMAKLRRKRYSNYLRAANQAQTKIDPFLKQRDGPD